MCKVRQQRRGPHEGRLLKGNQIYKLPIRPSDFLKISWCLLEVKHKKNVTFLEARKIVWSYIGGNTYACVPRRGYPFRQNN